MSNWLTLWISRTFCMWSEWLVTRFDCQILLKEIQACTDAVYCHFSTSKTFSIVTSICVAILVHFRNQPSKSRNLLQLLIQRKYLKEIHSQCGQPISYVNKLSKFSKKIHILNNSKYYSLARKQFDFAATCRNHHQFIIIVLAIWPPVANQSYSLLLML